MPALFPILTEGDFTAGIVGIALMAYLGDKLQRRALLASIGFAIAGVFVYTASSAEELAKALRY